MNVNIKNIIVVSTILLASVFASSCADEFSTSQAPEISQSGISYNDDGTMNVTVGLEIPEMTTAGTRTMADNPNFSDLDIYLLVFQGEDGLTQYTRLSNKDLITDDKHVNAGLVKFRVKLDPTEKDAVIHLIATDQPKFSEQIGSGMTESGVGMLYTENGSQAYWQRIDLGLNIPSQQQVNGDTSSGIPSDAEAAKKAEKIKEKLNHVPMVRNFCKVSVRFGDSFSEGSIYSITGLYVINTIDRGTVAAYRASYNDPDGFVEFFEEEKNEGKFMPYDYRTMTDDPTEKKHPSGKEINPHSQHYLGNLAAGVNVINKDVEHPENILTKSEQLNPNPIYFYERPARENSTERTYAIVKISKNIEENGAPKVVDYFYKIDFGHIWDPYVNSYMGVFEYYNLLRNFHFEIKINKIEGDGYPSLAEAANGPVFNNISGTVEAKSMKAISDGDDWIYVSRTSYVFTKENEKLELLAQFRENINQGGQGTINNSLLQNPILSDELNGFPKFVKHSSTNNGADNYIHYTLECVGEPGPEMRKQEFYIYRGSKNTTSDNVEYGLYRVVTLFMHEPWSFRNIDTFPGLWEDPDELPDFTWTDDLREVDASAGAPLTLFFELPPDLPMAIFPLEFVIESDRQNIQNAYEGNAVVRSVSASESLFATNPTPTIGKPTTSRIQYVKTVTWKDYNGDWGEDWTPKGNKMVRCRFLTITDLAQDGIGKGDSNDEATSVTTLRVYNEYFGTKKIDAQGNPTDEWLTYQEDGFKRDNASSDPTPHIWDFSNSNWNNILSNMGTGTPNTGRNKYTQNNNSTADDAGVGKTKNLHLIEEGGVVNNNRTMSTGTYNYTIKNGDEEETVSYHYIQTGNANDGFYFTYDYPKGEDREIRFDVMMTDTDDKVSETAVPQITGTGFQLDSTTPEIVDGTPFKKYSFTGKVPKTNSRITVTVQPPASAPNARFYRIEFYPRWDELKPKPQPEETDETTP